MTAAELCGNNQGLVKMYQPALMAPSPGASKPTVERDTPTSAVVNANQSPGMLAAVKAADLAVAKVEASDGPIAIVGAYNTSTSSGQLAFYAERMAKKGVIGVALANSPEFVPKTAFPPAAAATNSVAFGIPQAGGPPLTFDMATSAIALFAVSTPKSAIADVAMSNVSGGPTLRGMPKAIGLVPKTGLAPGAAATNSGEFAIAMPMKPFFAMRSQ